MPGFVRQHLRPLAGAAGLHLLLFALIVATAWRWSSSRPAAPLAIEGVVVDSRSLPAQATTRRPSTPAPTPPAPERVEPLPTVPAPAPDAEAEAQEREAAEARAEQERTEREAREQAALEARKAEQEAAERARQQKAAEEEATRKAAQADAERRKAAEQAQRRRESDEQQVREAELRRQLAAEEAETAAMAASGVVDQYRAELEAAIERNWIRPPSAQPGLECTLNVTQAPGGTVLDVKLAGCNGDAAVRESIVNAVFRASPLPPPQDPRAFDRRLEIVFRPTE